LADGDPGLGAAGCPYRRALGSAAFLVSNKEYPPHLGVKILDANAPYEEWVRINRRWVTRNSALAPLSTLGAPAC